MSTNKILNPLKVGLFGLLFVLSNYAFAATYYIDVTSGNDNNIGTSETQAWKTLSKVSSYTFQAGDVIAFKKDQTFQGELDVKGSGTIDSPITFTSYGTGDNPILTNNGTISGTWVNTGNNLWTLTTSFPTTRLWKNGIEQKVTSLERFGIAWSELGNSEGVVWIYSGGKIHYYSTSSPTGTFTAQLAYNTIDINGNSNIVFDGLNIEGAKHTVEMTNASNIKLANCAIGKGSETAVYSYGADRLILDNCDIDAHWTLFYTKAYTTKGTTYRGVNEGLGAYSYLKNSEIKNCNFKNWGHAGIALTSFGTNSHTNNKIHHNLFTAPDIAYGRGLAYSGNGANNNEIYYNHFKDLSLRNQMNGQNNHIHHNVFENIVDTLLKPGEQGQAIGLENYNGNPNNNTFEYNTFKDVDGPAIELVASGNGGRDISGNVFHKNLFDNCGRSPYRSYNKGMGIFVEPYVDVRANTYTNNAFINGGKVNHRSAYVTPTEFNAKTGVSGDIISGNVATITDQGAGDLSGITIGTDLAQSVSLTQTLSTNEPEEDSPFGGAFVLDPSGLH